MTRSNTSTKFNTKSTKFVKSLESLESLAKSVKSLESLAKSVKYLARKRRASLNAQVNAFAVQVYDETDYEHNSYSPPRPTKEFSDDSDDDSDDSDDDSDDEEAEAWHKHVKDFCKSHLGKGKKYDTFLKCVLAAKKTYKSKGYSHDNPCEGCGATGEYSPVEPTYCSCN